MRNSFDNYKKFFNAGPQMSLEAELTLEMLKKIFGGQSRVILSLIRQRCFNWEKFKDILIYHELVPFAYIGLKDFLSFLPQDLVSVLSASYYYYLKHTLVFERKFLDILSVFEAEGVVFVPIKGVALLEDLYVKYPVRPCTDIDVLVRQEDVDRACIILERLGFRKDLEGLKESYWKEKQYHFVFVTTSVNLESGGESVQNSKSFSPIVELHWGIDYPREGKHLLPEMFSRLRDFSIEDRNIRLLSVEDTFFSLALHQRRLGVTLSLKNVCDMVLLLNKYKFNFDWGYILKESKRFRIRATVFFALYQVNYLFGVDIPDYVWRDLKISLWKKNIISKFIKKSTFLVGDNDARMSLYLKTHFLLYDSFWEPIDYILNIPLEQFAKFYRLIPYSRKTEFFYASRFLYMPIKIILDLVNKAWAKDDKSERRK